MINNTSVWIGYPRAGEGGGGGRGTPIYSKTSFEKNCFSAWASTLNMGLINKADMVCCRLWDMVFS